MVIGGVMMALGVLFLVWTLKAQRDIGKGTPMPLMATQKLVVQKPYAWTRNPLAFGLLNLYFGISIFIGSLGSLLVVVIFSIIILSYIKFVEEKELEQRYGEDYVAYKQQMPFLIPRPNRK
jgi:protein-S-isoprenylcysteine O-methyltransferase Ste14